MCSVNLGGMTFHVDVKPSHKYYDHKENDQDKKRFAKRSWRVQWTLSALVVIVTSLQITTLQQHWVKLRMTKSGSTGKSVSTRTDFKLHHCHFYQSYHVMQLACTKMMSS
ncbi:hypothetical protein KIL84_001169 [Mauremys mutica]|uniref:Uncharacterized protein n=1 Tax=Mauremys mutica TaxID=74926 RepID=A0A9D3WU14_9SAUR|nr:hypothetical protein KIL84_001169 [Mauremys mutica]